MAITAPQESAYSEILDTKKILYMPSCLVVEMMTELYGQVSVINLSGDLREVIDDLLLLLDRLVGNLRTTARAYRESRIKFFLGDWKDDKLRARKLFFNIMSRLGYICEVTGEEDRGRLYEKAEEISSAWGELDGIMERKTSERTGRVDGSHTCLYFRSQHPAAWKQVMANAILSLDAEADYSEPETHLILLCYKRVRTAMLQAIQEIERKNTVARKFSPERILCVSQEDVPISCPRCTLMTDALRKGTSEVITRQYQGRTKTRDTRGATRVPGRKTVLTGIYPKPPGASCVAR